MVFQDLGGAIVEVFAEDVKNVLSVTNTETGADEPGKTGIILHNGGEIIVQGERGAVMKALWHEQFLKSSSPIGKGG